jgi:DNA modification methylase
MLELNKIHNIDCLEGLKLLNDNSIDCCVTSPPYWGLRDYGTAKWEGGNPDCDHALPNDAPNSSKMTTGQKTSHAGRFANKPCLKCGAIRIDKQLGLEPTPEEYVDKMVLIFREVKRVLKPEGTLWLNLGDSYASVHTGGHKSEKATVGNNKEGIQEIKQCKAKPQSYGLKEKDLVGIPWMVAFALRADGWYLRQDIIWAKPNPMPESVRDRCTKSHEYIFLMSKSAKYFYDYESIKQPLSKATHKRLAQDIANQKGSDRVPGKTNGNMKAVCSGLTFGGKKGREYIPDENDPNFRNGSEQWGREYVPTPDGKANKRDVWTVSTKPFKEAHFATFPPDLIEPCVLAGCPVNGIILDPFVGSGTTAMVARQNQRNYIGFELNSEYIDIANKRIEEHTSQIRLPI